MNNLIPIHRGKILRAKRDLVYFVSELMGVKPLYSYQKEMLKRFSVKTKLQSKQDKLWMEEGEENGK